MSDYLRKEEARVASEDFLWHSKVGMRFSMYIILECIQNNDLGLFYSKCTTNALSKGGGCFFKAHIEDNERYQGLVDLWTPFIHRAVAKVKQVG